MHVWAPSSSSANALEAAYAQLPENLRADTIVLITVCKGLRVLFEEKSSKKDLDTLHVAKCSKAKKGEKGREHMRVLQDSDPLRLRQTVRACTAIDP